jgi:hypothetical protein
MGWQSFQDLCCVIAEVEYKRPVGRVSKSKDEGRDGFFYGLVEKPLHENDERQTTLQSKHFSNSNSSLTLSTVQDDLSKVERLVQEGRADGYILISNGKLSEGNRKEIHDELKRLGVKKPYIFGKDWVESKILEHHKVRALVPRVYGLGDLSWITDGRAVDQAKAIISAMGRDLRCYVPTKSHQEAVEALSSYRFVLLLGDPAVGKSSIAAALAIAATDDSNVEVFFVRSPEEFLNHWDPGLENRLFWIDDAFGSIQYKPELMDRWNKVMTSIRSATDRGNRFIMTTRNYIWYQAYRDLKKGAFSPLRDGKIIVDVENLTIGEKERILYNHLKYGGQSLDTRKKLIPFLEGLVSSSSFRPEMARRLGDPIFTKNVAFTAVGIESFFENAQAFLSDTISDLAVDHQAALGAIFVAGGRLESPLSNNPEMETVLERFGVKAAEISSALGALRDSFVTFVELGSEHYWTFRHPTMADAYADIVARDPELVELYVKGVKVSQLLREATAGAVSVSGAKVSIPSALFSDLLLRLKAALSESPDAVRQFLLTRSDDDFFQLALSSLDQSRLFLGTIYRPASSHSMSRFVLRAFRLGVLNEPEREKFVEKLRDQIESEGDVDFLFKEPEFEELLGEQERQGLLDFARSEIVAYVEDLIDNEASAYDSDIDPEDFFDDLKFQFEVFASLFPGDDEVTGRLSDGMRKIEEKVEELKFKAYEHDSYDDYDGPRVASSSGAGGRSIFDDLAD